MSYELRQIQDYGFGQLSQAVAISDTTLNSPEFASRLPTGLNTSLYVPMVLQDQTNFEIVWINNHALSSTSCTVVRAKENTTARIWPIGTLWTIGPTQRDGVLPVPSRSNLPTDPNVGLRALIIDEGIVVEWSASTGWAQAARTLAGRVVTTAGTIHSLTDGTETQVAKLAVSGKPITLGTFYDLDVGLTGDFQNAAVSITVRVRQGATFASATEIATWSWLSALGGFATHSGSWSKPWRATSTNASTNFYVSVQRIAGTGTINIKGDRSASFVITDRGSDANTWLEVA